LLLFPPSLIPFTHCVSKGKTAVTLAEDMLLLLPIATINDNRLQGM